MMRYHVETPERSRHTYYDRGQIILPRAIKYPNAPSLPHPSLLAAWLTLTMPSSRMMLCKDSAAPFRADSQRKTKFLSWKPVNNSPPTAVIDSISSPFPLPNPPAPTFRDDLTLTLPTPNRYLTCLIHVAIVEINDDQMSAPSTTARSWIHLRVVPSCIPSPREDTVWLSILFLRFGHDTDLSRLTPYPEPQTPDPRSRTLSPCVSCLVPRGIPLWLHR